MNNSKNPYWFSIIYPFSQCHENGYLYSHMSHNYKFFSVFRVFVPCSWGFPFLFGVPPLSRPPAVWLLSRRGFGGGSPARLPATHQPCATPNPGGRGFSLSSFRSSFSFRPSFLLPPLKAASLAVVRLARVCLSRVCLAVIMCVILSVLACGGSRAVVLRAAHFHCIHL